MLNLKPDLKLDFMNAIKHTLIEKNTGLAFVGMMGVGKTTIGKYIAEDIALPFRDVDDLIVERAGMSIPDIFEMCEEAGFRLREHEATETLLSSPHVIATGGGAFAQDDTRALLLQKAVTIWLNEDIDVVYDRIKGDANRPKLASREEFHDTFNVRKPFYAQAHICVDVEGDDAQQVAEKVLSKVGEHLKL